MKEIEEVKDHWFEFRQICLLSQILWNTVKQINSDNTWWASLEFTTPPPPPPHLVDLISTVALLTCTFAIVNTLLSCTWKPSKFFKAKGSIVFIRQDTIIQPCIANVGGVRCDGHTVCRVPLLIMRGKGADLYLAKANTWGQALCRRGNWRQRKQLASAVICLPLHTAPRLPGPLYWHE